MVNSACWQVEGNELADQAAKEGGLQDQREADVDMTSATVTVHSAGMAQGI